MNSVGEPGTWEVDWGGVGVGDDFHAFSHAHMLPSCYVNMCVSWFTLEKSRAFQDSRLDKI